MDVALMLVLKGRKNKPHNCTKISDLIVMFYPFLFNNTCNFFFFFF